ncbi:glycosyl hydrolase [Enterococcus sp. 10A9_DIV0425]|uniref:Beta-galactosidase n=1 Tax=Candidatus Enterococcus wittei TaxID=1987383 RepID=A0A242JZI6_9ENTE|nr:beta-galactosidase family protein [Enterococcus sp. 10A9_DIV0425]OTP10341.1 glycosyl hydrolase [Enterococcus sp. 10A9_DIV0425]THE12925.1 beta-galactosidase [Enterococcus hirae]
MKTFEIKEEFLVDGQPVKLISGAIHYFRLPQSQWEDSLYNLKALGANTVETYIPWNLHEPQEGQFDFEGMNDFTTFVNMAQDLGLLVILRPSVYICAEWEFGGLPAWLLKEPGIRLRSADPRFMEKVKNYYKVLLPKIIPLQITHGGPVIMLQIENEYGSYAMDKEYLRQTKQLIESYEITVPLFTSDGTWLEALDAGTLIEDDVFVTGNFGSQSKENSQVLKAYFEEHGKKWPLMCMEYWDGWFNRWGEPIVKREAKNLANEVKAMLEVGSLNLYMFHGGTTFGFYNGCSARGNNDLPQLTSYDYDALLTEDGEPTEKYYAVQQAIKEVCPDVWQAEPRKKSLQDLGDYPITASVSLLHTKDKMMDGLSSLYPLTMENVSTGYGYVLYSLALKNYQHENKLRIIETNDRAHVYADGHFQLVQDQTTLGEEFMVHGQAGNEQIQLDVLVENHGRVNYGAKLNNPAQTKGIRGGIMQDIHFHQGYVHYPLPLDQEQLQKIDYDAGKDPSHPSFYQVTFDLMEPADTYIDCSSYGKGVIIVNGFNLGRYWNRGPIYSLYCPKDFLKAGKNEVVIFETEGVEIYTLKFSAEPNIETANEQ